MTAIIERMSAAGNVFHLALDLSPAGASYRARRLSRGLGLKAMGGAPAPASCDGLILCQFDATGPRQLMYNPDGSAGHCANGIRCLAALLAGRGLLPASGEIQSLDGPMRLRVDGALVSARLGRLRRLPGCPPPDEAFELQVGELRLDAFAAFVGNPQLVFFTDAATQERVGELGPLLQKHPRFPDGVNAEFVVADPAGWRVRVWERGAGETLSCGTGALAVAGVGPDGIARGEERVLYYPGGPLCVGRDSEDRMHLSGPVRHEGRYRMIEKQQAPAGSGEGSKGGAI